MKEGKRTGLKAKTKEQEIILDYLEENASDVLAQKIHDGKKTMDDCWKFIYECAKKAAAGKNCYGCAGQEVFGWAIHFFEEDSIKISDADKVVKTNKVEKPEEDKKTEKEQRPREKKSEEIAGQMSIFDFGFGG